MSQSDSAPDGPHQGVSWSSAEEEDHKNVRAFGKFLGQKNPPWLLEVGSWIFGGLIAFNLIVMAALIHVGPVDQAVLVGTAAFALSLPLDVTGLILLRLLQDLKQISLEEELARNFQDFDFTVGISTPAMLEALREKRTRVMLGYSVGILAPSALLTLAGMTAAMWHMAWWIGVGFFAMVLIALVIVNRAIVNSRPAESQEAKEERRHFREETMRQAKDPDQRNNQGT